MLLHGMVAMDMKSNELNNRVYIWYPPVLASILYGIYVISTNFSSPENFSWIFLGKTIIQFYGYLLLIIVADRTLDKWLKPDASYKTLLTFFAAWILSLIAGLIFYLVVKQ